MVLGLAKPTPLHAVSASNGFWGLLAGRPDKQGRDTEATGAHDTGGFSPKQQSQIHCPSDLSGDQELFFVYHHNSTFQRYSWPLYFSKRDHKRRVLCNYIHTRNEKHQVLVMKMPMGSPSCRLKGLVLPKCAFKY